MLPRNSESCLRSLMYYYNSQKKLIINDSKFTKDMRIAKDQILAEYPNIQIEIKNNISILNNGNEDNYCSILSRILHCNPISPKLFLHNMKNRPNRIDNDFVSQVNHQQFHGPASQPYSRNKKGKYDTQSYSISTNNVPPVSVFSSQFIFHNIKSVEKSETNDINRPPHSLPYNKIENNSLGIRVEKPKSFKSSTDSSNIIFETHSKDSSGSLKIQFAKSPSSSTPNSHSSAFDLEKYSGIPLEAAIPLNNKTNISLPTPAPISDIPLPPPPVLSTDYDLPPPPPLDTLGSAPNLTSNQNNSMPIALQRFDFASNQSDDNDDEITIQINDHHPHFDSNALKFHQDNISDDDIDYLEMPKFNPTMLYFSNNIQRNDHLDPSYIKDKLIPNRSELVPLTLKMLRQTKSTEEKIEIRNRYQLLKSSELDLLPVQNETTNEIPESVHSHIPNNSIKSDQSTPVLDFYPKQIHSCPGKVKNICFMPNNTMKIILTKQNQQAVNRILGLNSSIHYNSIIFQETDE